MIRAYFFDSSALVKRYVTEVGSDRIRSITAPNDGNQLIVARITWVEVLSAFARLQRAGDLEPVDVATVAQAYRYDFDMQYRVVELDRIVAQMAGGLVQRYPLRAYDGVQLASALKLQPVFAQLEASFTFMSADKRLLTVAQSEGLMIGDLNDQP